MAPNPFSQPTRRPDYTQQQDNPAWEMRSILQHLNTIIETEPELALARITGIIDDWLEQGGISPEEAHGFKRNLATAQETGRWSGITNNPAGAMQMVVYNFVMQAMNPDLQVLNTNAKFRRKGMGLGMEDISIRTMANLMTEDGEYRIDMSHEMMECIRFINKQGCEVVFKEDLMGFDEPPNAGAEGGEPVDVTMGAGEEPTPGGIMMSVEVTTEEGAGSAVASMLDWAETNGCPQELCDAVRDEIGDEAPHDEEIPGEEIPGDEAPEPVTPGGEIEAPPGAGPLRQRSDMPA